MGIIRGDDCLFPFFAGIIDLFPDVDSTDNLGEILMWKFGLVLAVFGGYSGRGSEERTEEELFPMALHVARIVMFVTGKVQNQSGFWGINLCQAAA